jgi:hypothetical protein
MGLYAEQFLERQGSTLLISENYPGISHVKVYQLVAEIENRTDCFCCTCGDREGSDPACRNHGWAAQRPCDIHGFPGQPWDDDESEMPEPVTVYRERHSDVG